MGGKVNDFLFARTEEPDVQTGGIVAGVRFGTPKKDCKGSGICEIFELKTKKDAGCSGCRLNARITARGRSYLEFRFLSQDIKEYARKKYFQHKYFIMEEDLALPDFLKEELKVKAEGLAGGTYLIRYGRRYTTICIRLKKRLKPVDLIPPDELEGKK